MPSLFVIQGRNKGSRYDLTAHEGAMSIGRDAGNAIQLEDNEVSRRHAEIRHIGDTLVVGDLKSSNGTYLNNRKIERAELTSGDHLQVGRTVFVFSRDRENERAIELVDIVSPSNDSDGSRIVRTIREDEAANAVAAPEDTQNRWLARARSNLQVMYRTALAVSHTLDIDELLGRILQLIFEWVEADRGCIMLLDPETKQLRTKARRDRNVNAATSMAISRTILDYVLDHREGCIPLQGRYDTVGVIYIDTTVPLAESIETGQHRFTDEHLKLMMAIGHQAALAVEDTTYYSAMVQSERLAAIGQTIATLSHHIKNILQGIRGGSYLVEMGLDNEDPAVLRKGWDIVARNQNKISSLVMDMLSFSKEREPDPLPSDLVALVSDIVETVQQRAAESKTAIHWEPPTAAIPRLLFDPEAMSRAVLNVVSNALDAVENRPDAAIGIRLDCQEQEKMVRITITDNGEGISADSLQDIFTLFVSTKGARGTGLGLTVSRKILREHGGDIQVTSQLGEGSEFVLIFPMTISESELSPERMRTIAESFADPDADAPTAEIP